MSVAQAMDANREVGRKLLLTPEGVPLNMEIASVGDRLGAYILDNVFIFLGLIVTGFLAQALAMVNQAIGQVTLMILQFVLMNFYFILFEIRWLGRTPGKRIARTRVIDRAGRPLMAEAVCVRNFVRLIETWIPLLVLFASHAVFPGAPAWTRLLAALWLLAIMVFPLCNRQRLRLGDLMAGTMVVKSPRSVLLKDLTSQRAQDDEPARFTFTREQLEMYGIYELQVLESMLRTPNIDTQALKMVYRKITRKIAWDPPPGKVPLRRFLEEFYHAQRSHLESKMLLGKRQERKRKGKLESTQPTPSPRDSDAVAPDSDAEREQ